MKVKTGFILRKIGDESIVVPVDDMADKIQGVITLNETGAFLWELLQKETSVDDLSKELHLSFGVSLEIAQADVKEYIDSLTEYGCIE